MCLSPWTRMVKSILANHTSLVLCSWEFKPSDRSVVFKSSSPFCKMFDDFDFLFFTDLKATRDIWLLPNSGFSWINYLFLGYVWRWCGCCLSLFFFMLPLTLFPFLMFQIPLTSVSFWRGDVLNSPNLNYMLYMKICNSGRRKSWCCIIHLNENL